MEGKLFKTRANKLGLLTPHLKNVGIPAGIPPKVRIRLKRYLTMKREAGGQGEFSGEFSVGLAARRDVVSQPAT
jgi:hypothetical protein